MNEKSIEQDAILNAPKTSPTHSNPLLGIAIALLSYSAVSLIHPFHMGVTDTIILICFISITFLYTWMNYPLSMRHYKHFAFMLLCCIPNLLFDNYFLKFFNFIFILLLCGWFLVDATHKQIGKDMRHYILFDLFNAMIVNPLNGFNTAMSSLFKHLYNGIHARHVVGIFAGFLLSIPILFIVLPLLISADASFQNFIQSIAFHIDDLFIQVLYFILAIPVFVYLYPFLYVHVECERTTIVKMDARQIDTYATKIAKTPASIPLTMEMILSGIYALFLIMTCSELFNSIDVSLSQFSYSAFARRGFFELCVIALINITILGFVHLFTKEKDSHIFRSIQAVLCIATILIIFTAMGKMSLYVYAYGLTPLRVYSSWFMFLLLGIFLLMIYHICTKKRFLMYHIVLYFCICFFALNILNMNHFINYYNENVPHLVDTERYL